MTKSRSTKARVDKHQINAIRGLRLPAWQRWQNVCDSIRGDLKKNGEFFKTALGPFYFDSAQKRVFALDENIRLGALLNSQYGVNPNEYCFKLVLGDLQSEAENYGTPVEVRVFAHFDRSTKCLYVSRFNGSMYRLDGTSVTEVANGTDSVFFFDDRANWESYTYRHGTPGCQLENQLIKSVNFAESTLSADEQRLFLKLWLLSVFFGSIQPTKIIMLLIGEQGSGKTSALRRIQKFLFGTKVNLLSIEKDKQDGFIATVTSDPIALFDNLDERISWLPFNLSRLATG